MEVYFEGVRFGSSLGSLTDLGRGPPPRTVARRDVEVARSFSFGIGLPSFYPEDLHSCIVWSTRILASANFLLYFEPTDL